MAKLAAAMLPMQRVRSFGSEGRWRMSIAVWFLAMTAKPWSAVAMTIATRSEPVSALCAQASAAAA